MEVNEFNKIVEQMEANEAMNINVYETGNTCRLQCKFDIGEDGEILRIDPPNVLINIYNNKYELLETIPYEKITREDIGVYIYNYKLPDEETRIVYEWLADFNGQTFFRRNSIRTTFIS